jgi:hypothetical protein
MVWSLRMFCRSSPRMLCARSVPYLKTVASVSAVQRRQPRPVAGFAAPLPWEVYISNRGNTAWAE